MAKATVKDLVRLSGWSLGTVSRVLNNQKGVSAKARCDVLEAARRLGYQRDEHARSLRLVHDQRIDLILGSDNPWYERLANALRDQSEHVCRIQKACSKEQEEDYLQQTKSTPMLAVFLDARTQFISNALGRMECPAICAGAARPDLDPSRLQSLAIASADASMEAVERLFEAGCTNIGVICQDREHSPEMQARYLGVQYAFYSRDLVFSSAGQSASAEDSPQAGYGAMMELHEKMKELDGLFVFSSRQAFGALRALKDLGLQPGRDLALICMDDSAISQYAIPRMDAMVRNFDAELGDLQRMINIALDRSSRSAEPLHLAAEWQHVPAETLALGEAEQ